MKNRLRMNNPFNFAALASAAALMFSLAALPAHASTPVEQLVAKLAGTWNEVMRAQPSCADKKYLHSFSLSADGLVLTKRFVQPFEGNFGPVAEERYRVVYGDEKSVMVFKEGETFELRDTGDKLLRQLILESDTSYAWRMYGMPRDHRAAAGGLRCSR